MRKVSTDFKRQMNNYMRNRAYISVAIGVVNQEAQGSAQISGEFAPWSNKNNITNSYEERNVYATLEQKFTKADGKFLFMPRINPEDTGIITKNVLGSIRFDFSDRYNIKGLTLYFVENCYPTRFNVITEDGTIEFTNNSTQFITTEVLGDTKYVIIQPLEMVGGSQRFRITYAVMGVGISFNNNEVANSTYSEYISGISEEVSNIDFSVDIFDKQNRFNVDDDNSFINFLETGQMMTVSEGLELDDGTIEFVQLGTLYLKDWNSRKGHLTLNAVDKFALMEDEYSLGYKIYERTAYEEAVSIFEDMGLQPDEYLIDDYLKSINLTNPMPVATHKECLQILANACRCMVFQDSDGRIVIRGNFAVVLDPEDMEIETNGVTDWSKPENIVIGTDVMYAEMKTNFMRTDGSMYFLPKEAPYLETGYVSKQVSRADGTFEENPTLTVILPAGYSYYGLSVDFGVNAPEELIVHTYYNGDNIENISFADLEPQSVLFYQFSIFDKLIIEFTKTKKNNRIVVNRLNFGDATDYVLKRSNMTEQPYGYKEETTKSVSVKIFTYENDEEGNPKEIEDSVFYKNVLNTTGKNKMCSNPLISTMEQAQELAEWLGNYYKNNVSYSVSYRGDPRLNAQDIIHMESEVVDNLQVEIERLSLKFNGAWSGELEMRKALKLN